MINRILNSQAKTITAAAVLLGASALLSRVFGLIRNGLIAGHFGRGIEADVYFAAFRIPDFVYNILIAGAIIVAFLPLFSEYYSKNKEKAWEMVNYVLNIFLFLLILLSAILFIFTPQLIGLIAPGFSAEAKKMTINLTRLMFLSPIFFGLSSIFSGILHYFNRFLVYSLAPILYNLGIIFGILVLSPYYGIFGVGIGVVIGAIAHFLIQIPAAIKCGFRYKFLFNFRYPGVKRIFKLMIPRMFAVGAQQINLIVITAIASTIATGSIAIFTYAKDIYYLPIGIIAIPYALACFPALSRSWAENQKDKFKQQFSNTFRQILFWIIPFSVLLFILRAQIVRLILGTLGPGSFDWLATQLTAACLGIFCLGIFSQALVALVVRAFFAFQDTKTPTLITVASVALNVVLSFYFVGILAGTKSGWLASQLITLLKLKGIANIAILGLPLAFGLSLIFQLFLLLFFLNKKTDLFKGQKQIYISLLKIILASVFSGIIAYALLYLMNYWVDTHTVSGLLLQTIFAGSLGTLTYLSLSFILKLPELRVRLKHRSK